MELQSKIGCYLFLAEPFHCDFSHRLFMGHLGNHLLNAADFHSNDRGFGMNYLNPNHKTWVLSRLAIEMEKMPQAYAKFYVETWVESALRFFTNRNFKIEDAETGKIYGYGRSVWAMIDTETRQPVDLLAVHDGAILDYIDTDKACPIEKSSRVKMSDSAQLIRTIDTYYNDVDMNGHINSVKYIEHVLDLFDLNWYRTYDIRRFEIAYVAETHQGDQLHFYREESAETEFCIRITKSEPTSSDEVEVCRSKIRFLNKK
ncbi:MAG: acyl-[Prevotella sp.]|nr:acyl-[acyl-carrier-protein] thioesterase [Prevotella sp.]